MFNFDLALQHILQCVILFILSVLDLPVLCNQPCRLGEHYRRIDPPYPTPVWRVVEGDSR
jgi:hypothetical protein